MKASVLALISAIVMVYPLFIYWGIEQAGPRLFALLLCIFVLTRFYAMRERMGLSYQIAAVVTFIYCVFILFTDSDFLLRLYPVFMNLFASAFFALSLLDNNSLIERLAVMAGKEITDNARRYTYRLTAVWAVVLFLNALLCLYLAVYGTLEVWALYSGLISYLVMALLFLGELVYRQFYIRKYGA